MLICVTNILNVVYSTSFNIIKYLWTKTETKRFCVTDRETNKCFIKTLHYRLARYLELMCFKLSHLSNYVCFCYGISVHENNYDTSRRQKRFHTIWSRNTLQIFTVNPVELGKSEDRDFSCIKLALQKVSVSRKYKSNQKIITILCELVC